MAVHVGEQSTCREKSPSIACFATPRRPKTLSVSSGLFCSKEFFNLEVPTCLLACTLRLLHTFPSLESYSWINDVSSFLKRGLFDAFFFPRKKLWLMAIFSLLFPSFDFTTFPPPICISCSVSHSFSSSVAELCINAVWIRVMSLARGLANYWSPMLLYHQ